MGLFDIFSSSGGEKNARSGYKLQTKALNQGFDIGAGALNQGYNQSQGYLKEGLPAYDALIAYGKQGMDAYGNLAGLNGAEAAAQANKASPGYQFQLSQGLQALDRNRANTGGYNSGNWGTDSMDYASGLASQDYFKRLGALQPYFGLGQNAAAGQAAIHGQQSDVAQNRATGMSRLAMERALPLAQAGYDLYGNINNAQTAADQAPWSLLLGLANAGASAHRGAA
jgi:hypothetical protein